MGRVQRWLNKTYVRGAAGSCPSRDADAMNQETLSDSHEQQPCLATSSEKL